MLKIFCKITGDDYTILSRETPESRKKVSALATVVFIPVIIWFAIGFLLSTQIMGLDKSHGLLIGSILALLIFILERTIIMANGNGWIKWFRIILGIVIAALGAIFLDEIVFHDDIEHQIVKMRAEAHDHSFQSVEALYNERLNTSTARVDALYADWQKAMQEASSEADGTGGSGRRGISDITILKIKAADDLKHQYEIALTEHNGLIDAKNIAINDLVVENNNVNYNGILIRVKALFQLVFSDWVMALIYGLFTLFLFCMEFLVVLIKMGWRTTNYERRLEMIEEIGRRRMEKLIIHNDSYNPTMNSSGVINARNYLNNERNHLSVFN